MSSSSPFFGWREIKILLISMSISVPIAVGGVWLFYWLGWLKR